mmetsp:Transcript_38139/g.89333  ORF Transcript_38139/g.89333 Transcript_38139/m.89333 type:complete len:267 (+) Transcript_38139:3864-4664(+)
MATGELARTARPHSGPSGDRDPTLTRRFTFLDQSGAAWSIASGIAHENTDPSDVPITMQSKEGLSASDAIGPSTSCTWRSTVCPLRRRHASSPVAPPTITCFRVTASAPTGSSKTLTHAELGIFFPVRAFTCSTSPVSLPRKRLFPGAQQWAVKSRSSWSRFPTGSARRNTSPFSEETSSQSSSFVPVEAMVLGLRGSKEIMVAREERAEARARRVPSSKFQSITACSGTSPSTATHGSSRQSASATIPSSFSHLRTLIISSPSTS